MSDSVAISSVNDSARLTFSQVSGESFQVMLEHPDFSGRVIASTYHVGPPSLLAEMAAEWRGWRDTKKWAGLEDDLEPVMNLRLAF